MSLGETDPHGNILNLCGNPALLILTHLTIFGVIKAAPYSAILCVTVSISSSHLLVCGACTAGFLQQCNSHENSERDLCFWVNIRDFILKQFSPTQRGSF